MEKDNAVELKRLEELEEIIRQNLPVARKVIAAMDRISEIRGKEGK